MRRDERVAVIIPALNEAGHIGPLVEETLRQPVESVIVVDNGSTDGTGRLAREAGADVVVEPRRGYGYACAAGSRKALLSGAAILVYMDGDFSSPPGELSRVLSPIWEGRADLVLGSRIRGEIASGAMPPHQRFGNWFSAVLMRLVYGVSVTDLGPFRAIRAEWLERLDMKEMTFGWPTEMMVKAARQGGSIVEVPVSWHIRKSGRSKVGGTVSGSVRAAYTILRVTLKYAYR